MELRGLVGFEVEEAEGGSGVAHHAVELGRNGERQLEGRGGFGGIDVRVLRLVTKKRRETRLMRGSMR